MADNENAIKTRLNDDMAQAPADSNRDKQEQSLSSMSERGMGGKVEESDDESRMFPGIL